MVDVSDPPIIEHIMYSFQLITTEIVGWFEPD